MRKITVPVLWDANNNFLNNALVSVDTSSVVVTIVPKPLKVYPPNNVPTLQTTIQIKAPEHDTLYVNMPLSAYQAAIRTASGSAEPLIMTKMYSIASASTTITDPVLTGATLVAVWQNGVNLNITGMLTGDVLTFPSSLEPGDTVGVIYYTN